MSKHTPGPWELDRWMSPDAEGWSIRIGAAPHQIEISNWAKESEGDARLIAAAPTMLAALKKALNESGCDGDLCMHQWHDVVRKAIRDAEEGP